MNTMMRAAVVSSYGEPTTTIAVGTAPRLTASPGHLLVRVHAANVSIGDHHVVTGRPYLVRLSPFGGFPRPRHRVPGTCFAGVVVDGVDGSGDFAVGDRVFGEAGHGAFGELVVVAINAVAKMPPSATFTQAAALTWGQTALKAVRDAGQVRAGQHVVVNGAGGGVGTHVVQLLKHVGARITAVCSTRNVELVRELGADDVVDYAQRDPRDVRGVDIVIDLVGNHSARSWRSVLVNGGTFVACSGAGGDVLGPLPAMLAGIVAYVGSGRRYRPVVQAPSRVDLEHLAQLFEQRQLRPVIERVVDLDGLPAALVQVGLGRGRGQTVVTLSAT